MIALKTWRELRGMTLVYLLILELMLIPAILLWPDLYADLQRPSALLQNIPFDFFKRAVDGMRHRDMDTAFLNYMALQMFFKGVNVAGIACAVLLCTGLIARERENATLEFLMGRPVSRARILWSKSWVTVLCLVVPVFLTSWSAIGWSDRIGFHLPLAEVTLASAHSAAFVLLVAALTVLFSVFCRVQAHVAFWVGGIVILELAIFFIPDIRHFSVFRLSDFDVYGPVMVGNLTLRKLFWSKTVWLLLGAAAVYGIALQVFRRSDL